MYILELKKNGIFNEFIHSPYLQEYLDIKQELNELINQQAHNLYRSEETLIIDTTKINEMFITLYENFFTEQINIQYFDEEDNQLIEIEKQYLLYIEKELHKQLMSSY